VNWAQVLFNSAITGSLYLIGAVGLTLTYGLSKFPNFAHAEFIALGAFIGYLVAEQLGLGFALALPVAFLVTGVVGLLCYRGIFQPLAKRGASIIHLMVASIALGFIFRHSIGAAWTWKPLYFTIIANVKNKGLVIKTGCSHAGIINIVNQAIEVAGSNKIDGIIGGLHLVDASDDIIRRTVEELSKLNVAWISAGHCTGFKAQVELYLAFRERFLPLHTGMQFEVMSTD